MHTFEVKTELVTVYDRGPDSRRLAEMLAIPPGPKRHGRIDKCECRFEVPPGQSALITGPSGSGKSTLLGLLQQCVEPAERTVAGQSEICERSAVAHLQGHLVSRIRSLRQAGLTDGRTLLRRGTDLSPGEQWRLRLAMALHARPRFLFVDDFCMSLTPLVAATIAHEVADYAAENNCIVVAASPRTDFACDLNPYVLVCMEPGGSIDVHYRDYTRSRRLAVC